MKRNILFAITLATVALLSYMLGRKHGTGTPEPTGEQGPRQTGVAISVLPQASTGAANASLPSAAAAQTNLQRAIERGSEWFLHELENVKAGYEAARLNPADALKQIAMLPEKDRKGFVTGVFTFVGQQSSPTEALNLYRQQSESIRRDALRALVAEWTMTRGGIDGEPRVRLRESVLASGGGRLGLEVELALSLASSQPAEDLARAWLDCFAKHPGRSEMLPALAGKMIRDNPDTFWTYTDGWSPWEQQRAARTILETWADNAPQEAWKWYQSNQNRLGGDLAPSILEAWARADLESTKELLNSPLDDTQRRSALEAIGKALALRNTVEAINWADSLAKPTDQAFAHRAIYEATPRGIGAAISTEDGFPTLRGILPGSPLENSGIRPGDRIVEIRQADGTSQSLYGIALESAVKLIRGEPGSQVELRVLRRNETTDQLEEYLVPVRRAQLYFTNSPALPAR